jgi:ferritin
MLSENLIELLNDQVNREFYSSNLYLQMSAWAEHQGLEGTASFLRAHADEEMMHMRKMFDFMNESDAMATIGQLDAPPTDYDDIRDVFEQIYEHEKHITQCINVIVHAAFGEQDYSTFNFMQWYVAEQREEEHLVKSILDKVSLIGTKGEALFFLDREIGDLVANKPVMGSLAEEG